MATFYRPLERPLATMPVLVTAPAKVRISVYAPPGAVDAHRPGEGISLCALSRSQKDDTVLTAPVGGAGKSPIKSILSGAPPDHDRASVRGTDARAPARSRARRRHCRRH